MHIDLLMLKRLQPSASAVGYYGAAGTFARTPFFLLSAFYGVLLPLVASAHAANNSKLVRDYTDILEELNLMTVTRQMEISEIIPASETEALLLKQLGAEPTHIDEVCRSSGLQISTVSSTLAMMELKGLVKQVGPMSYSLSREARQEYKVRMD